MLLFVHVLALVLTPFPPPPPPSLCSGLSSLGGMIRRGELNARYSHTHKDP